MDGLRFRNACISPSSLSLSTLSSSALSPFCKKKKEISKAHLQKCKSVGLAMSSFLSWELAREFAHLQVGCLFKRIKKVGCTPGDLFISILGIQAVQITATNCQQEEEDCLLFTSASWCCRCTSRGFALLFSYQQRDIMARRNILADHHE